MCLKWYLSAPSDHLTNGMNGMEWMEEEWPIGRSNGFNGKWNETSWWKPMNNVQWRRRKWKPWNSIPHSSVWTPGSRFADDFYGLRTTVSSVEEAYHGADCWAGLWLLPSANLYSFDWKFYWVGKEHLEEQPIPSELDYSFWLGPAPYKALQFNLRSPDFPWLLGLWFRWPGRYGPALSGSLCSICSTRTRPVDHGQVDAPQQHPDAVGTWRQIKYTYARWLPDHSLGWRFSEILIRLTFIGPKGNVYKNFVCDIPWLAKKLAEFPEHGSADDRFHYGR